MKKPEDQLIAALRELGNTRTDSAAKARVWNRLNRPAGRPLQLLQWGGVFAAVALAAWIGFGDRNETLPGETFDATQLSDEEFALELYGAVVVGEFDSANAFAALDEGRLPIVQEAAQDGEEEETLTDAHPMDELLLTYQSNLYGQGLLRYTSNINDQGEW